MSRYLLGRVIQGVVLLFIISLVTFFIIRTAPGGPIILTNPDVGYHEMKEMAKTLQLDLPIYQQYGIWLRNMMSGRLGKSYSKGYSVATVIWERLPNTLLLTVTSLILAVMIAVPLGIISAVHRYTFWDYLATSFSFLGLSIPVFWFGIMLIILFSVKLGILPSSGMLSPGRGFHLFDLLKHIIMPTIVMSTFNMAQIARYARSSMISVLKEDFIRTARAKGLGEIQVILRHAFRNTLIPVVTIIGLSLPNLVGGAAITESVFGWPGVGSLAVTAAIERDYPLILAITLVVSLVVIVGNMIIDVLYIYLDPRIKLT